MSRFFGAIGYAIQKETAPGVWTDNITEINYRGDLVLNQQRWQKMEGAPDTLTLDNSISIIADPFAYANSGFMKYVIWNDQKWKIQSLEIKHPRIIIQIGGLYNAG